MKLGTTAKVIASCSLFGLLGGCSMLPKPVADAFSDKAHITADFTNVAGMYEGNSVDVLGVPVGKIDKITPKGDLVEVSMSIDSDVKLPADVKAAELSPSIITNRHIELTPAYSGQGPTLADGAHIPVDRTRTPVDIDEVLKTLDRITKDLQGNAKAGEIGPMSGRIAYGILDGNGQKMHDIISSLSTSLKLGIDNRDALTSTITRLNELTTVVAQNDQSVRDFSSNLTNLSGILAEQAPGLKAVLAQLEAFLANTSVMLANNKDTLGAALTRLTATTDLLRENARNLTETVDVAPLLFQNVNNAVSRDTHSIRTHILTDKSLADGELINLFCERIQMKSDGCRTGKPADFGPDLGIMQAMMGITR